MSTDRDDIWGEMKSAAKERFDADRAKFLGAALMTDDGHWTKHTEFHWSRQVEGQRLDFWPSRNKYQYAGRVMRGDVMAFICKTEQKS